MEKRRRRRRKWRKRKWRNRKRRNRRWRNGKFVFEKKVEAGWKKVVVNGRRWNRKRR